MESRSNMKLLATVLVGLCALALATHSVLAVITVQIGGASRLSSLNRQRERYNCHWDCDLVGCQIAHDDDECAYECQKICRVSFDYAGRSGAAAAAAGSSNAELEAKSAAAAAAAAGQPLKPEVSDQAANELVGAGTSVRLHLPRNASARNFAIWERCAQDTTTGKLTEKPFNL